MAEYTDDDDALLDELGVEAEAKPTSRHTRIEERVIAGFEDIQRFVEQHGRPPQHGEERDIFERLYAVRLDRLRALPEHHPLLQPMDHQQLLANAAQPSDDGADDLDDDELLAQLGVDTPNPGDITDLRHVRSATEKKAAEDIANRQRCDEFDRFKPMFDQVQDALATGQRQTRRFERKSEITLDRFYILGGQKAYVAAMDGAFTNDQGKLDARLRVVFDNGTESNLLMRSLQRALQQDPTGRRIVEPTAGPLFPDPDEPDDGEASPASGTVYVLRSKSDHPAVAANRNLLHKIGVTGGSVSRRVANARLDPTFLMADVDVVATYDLFGIDRTALEQLLHRIFGATRLDIEVKDRFGQPITPREWFLVPLFIIDEAIERVRAGTITGYAYDPQSVRLVKHPD